MHDREGSSVFNVYAQRLVDDLGCYTGLQDVLVPSLCGSVSLSPAAHSSRWHHVHGDCLQDIVVL